MQRVRLSPSFLPPVLQSKSASEQAEICRALEQDIRRPIGIIEKMHVADVAAITFEYCGFVVPKQGLSTPASEPHWKASSRSYKGALVTCLIRMVVMALQESRRELSP